METEFWLFKVGVGKPGEGEKLLARTKLDVLLQPHHVVDIDDVPYAISTVTIHIKSDGPSRMRVRVREIPKQRRH